MKFSIETRITKSEADFEQIQKLVEGARAAGEPWASSWSTANLRDEFHTATVCVAECPAAIPPSFCGFVFVRPPGAAWEITLIAVHPASRGKGVLAALLNGCGASKLHLEVRSDNRFAIEAYERLGFKVVGRRRGYYQDGVDAVLYSRD